MLKGLAILVLCVGLFIAFFPSIHPWGASVIEKSIGICDDTDQIKYDECVKSQQRINSMWDFLLIVHGKSVEQLDDV